LQACGPQEILQLCRGLEGRFVPPVPAGAFARPPDVLPTGRNFFSVDTRAVPTPTSWTLGLKSAQLLVERYTQEHGDYPQALGLSVWGTATMRTGGDDIAQAFALLGVRPSGRMAAGASAISGAAHERAGPPARGRDAAVSGFFRDAFTNVIRLFDAAVQKVASLEDEDDGPIPSVHGCCRRRPSCRPRA
jgi:cobaltochelatase CobN